MSALELSCAHVDADCGLCAVRLRDALHRMPEDGATKSRDYGRGYAQAIRDVVNLTFAEAES